MEKIIPHKHNDNDSPKLFAGDSLVSAPQEALTTGTSSTAGATYTSVEQDMINNLKTRVAEMETKFQTLGLLK
jgi:hypothetical protein